jgi:hypothetical protein
MLVPTCTVTDNNKALYISNKVCSDCKQTRKLVFPQGSTNVLINGNYGAININVKLVVWNHRYALSNGCNTRDSI